MYFTNDIECDKLISETGKTREGLHRKWRRALWKRIIVNYGCYLSQCLCSVHAHSEGDLSLYPWWRKNLWKSCSWLEEDEMLDVTAITQSAPVTSGECFGDHRISDRRGNRFTDSYSWYNSSADDHYFHHLTVLWTVPYKSVYQYSAAGDAGRCGHAYLWVVLTLLEMW